ncbi:MAG: hypothetical protein GEU80_13430 [Dehalococcoidia bacterium]|nr:hypothetical protein [Dehalococcoidia bacterium]
MSGAGGFSAALERGDYEVAALRLLLGAVEALREASPSAREELIALLAEPAPPPAPRTHTARRRHR